MNKNAITKTTAIITTIIIITAIIVGIVAYSFLYKPKPKLTIWMCPMVENVEEVTRPLLNGFKDKYGVEIELLVVPWGEITEKVLSAYAAKAGPDLIYTSHDRLGYLAYKGMLLPIDDVIEEFRPKVTSEELLERVRLPNDPHYYTLPFDSGYRFWAVNTDILKKANVPDEMLDKMKKGEWTIEDFKYLCKIVHERVPDAYFFVYPGGTRAVTQFIQWTWVFGSKWGVLDKPFGDPIFESKEVLDTIKFLAELKPYMPTGFETLPATIDLWASGKLGFQWVETFYEMTEAWPKSYPSIHWQIVTPPVGPTGAPEVYEWAIYWAILNNIPEEKKNIAKEFLRYLVTDGQKWVVENEGLIPVNKDYVNLIYEKYKGTICIEALNLYKNLPSHGEPVHPNIQEIVNIYNSELQKVFLGEKTPEQAVKDMQKMALEVTKK